MFWQGTKNYVIETSVELLIILFLYFGWGNIFLHWFSELPFVKSLLTPDSSIYFNLAFIICVVGTVIWISRLVLKGLLIPSPSQISISIGLLIILFSCRINGMWIFFNANYCGCEIAYLDILGLIPALFLLCSAIKGIANYKPQIGQLFEKKKDGEETLEVCKTALKDNDRPIENEDEDWLGRSRFAEDLSRRILEQDVNNESSSIAIIAPWGNGKTSFLNLIKGHIQKSKDIQHTIIDFSPWAYTSPVNVTKTFFETLALAVRPLNRKLASSIERYMMVLSDMNIPALSTLGRIYRSDNSLHALYNLIHDGLKRSSRTYIIDIKFS